MYDVQDDVIETCDPESGAWSVVPKRNAMKVDESTWELCVPNVDDRQQFRVNGDLCRWGRKINEPKVLLRKAS